MIQRPIQPDQESNPHLQRRYFNHYTSRRIRRQQSIGRMKDITMSYSETEFETSWTNHTSFLWGKTLHQKLSMIGVQQKKKYSTLFPQGRPFGSSSFGSIRRKVC